MTDAAQGGGGGGGGGPTGGEEKEDLFIFNNTIEGSRAPAVKPGRITQVLKHE